MITTSSIATNNSPYYATSNSSSSGTASTSSGSSSSGSLSTDYNSFLTLLTTQLQNQDPLSPLDTSQYVQELVSLNQVEQQITTNSNLGTLIQQQSADQTMQASSLVGKTIQYSSSTAALSGGQATYNYTLPSTAASAILSVADANGNIVYSTTGDTSAGQHSFTWNGQTSAGQQESDGGDYSLQVVATNSKNSAITATVSSGGTVTAVTDTNNQAMFNVSGYSVPVGDLISVGSN